MRISSGAAVRNTIRHRAIYDGRELLGTLEQVDTGKYIARNRQRRAIGTYDTAAEAIEAIAAEAARP
jgi:hypothetical protein